MDLEDFKHRFYASLEVLLSNKRQNNKALMTNAEYNKKITELCESRTRLKSKGVKKTVRDYRLVKKYDIMNIDGEEKLIKLRRNPSDKVMIYVNSDELFDILHNVHLLTGHGGRNKMSAIVKTKYCNVTKEAIMLYLGLCKSCQSRNAIAERALRKNIESVLKSRAHLDIIGMEKYTYDGYKFVMVYCDLSSDFVLLKPLKTNETQEIVFNLVNIFASFGAPIILDSRQGRQFVNLVISDLRSVWTDLRIINGKRYRCDSLESLNLEEAIQSWMKETGRKDWPLGLNFIQIQANHTLFEGKRVTSFESMFGCKCKFGGQKEEIGDAITEEDIETRLNSSLTNEDDYLENEDVEFNVEDKTETPEIPKTSIIKSEVDVDEIITKELHEEKEFNFPT